MILKHWRPVTRGSLRGFAEVELDIGLVIPDIKVFDGAEGVYVALPDKPAMRNGEVQRSADGKTLYVPLLKRRDRQTADKFSASVIPLLWQRYPEALGRGDPRT